MIKIISKQRLPMKYFNEKFKYLLSLESLNSSEVISCIAENGKPLIVKQF